MRILAFFQNTPVLKADRRLPSPIAVTKRNGKMKEKSAGFDLDKKGVR
jgi:hypothetical protein